MGTYEKLFEPITDTIPKIKVDTDAEKVERKNLRGTIAVYADFIWKPEALVSLISIPPESTFHWVYTAEEVQFILGGKAELTYSTLCNRYTTEKKMTVEKGDAYLLPRGADVTFETDSSGPLQIFNVVMPAYHAYKKELTPSEGMWPE